jgi:hypothetical protein
MIKNFSDFQRTLKIHYCVHNSPLIYFNLNQISRAHILTPYCFLISTASSLILLWCIDPLLGNDSVNTFPQEQTRATIGSLLLGSGSVNTPKTIWDSKRQNFSWGPPRGYIKRSFKGAASCQKFREFSWRRVHLSELLSRIGSSSGDGSLRWLRRNDKKGNGLWQEDFICDMNWQLDSYKSVARIRLKKIENPNVCATVNCKVCRSALAL